MKKDNVKLGRTYACKVSGSVVPVWLDRESPHGGWVGTNMKTRKEVRVKSAQRLRGLWPKKTMPVATAEATAGEREAPPSAPKAKRGRKATKDATGQAGRDTGERGGKGAKPKRLSILDAAANVLEERDPADGPLSCQQMVERMRSKGYWEPRKGGLTPANTLYSALLREIKARGEESRFDKVERGRFSLTLKR